LRFTCHYFTDCLIRCTALLDISVYFYYCIYYYYYYYYCCCCCCCCCTVTVLTFMSRVHFVISPVKTAMILQ